MQIFLMWFNISMLIFSLSFLFLNILYFIVGFILRIFKNKKTSLMCPMHKFAILIPARNESSVIANLIKSLKCQNYPSDLFDIYVIADNCTDNTKEIAHQQGAIVIERNDTQNIGKGYTLDYAIKHINQLRRGGSYLIH